MTIHLDQFLQACLVALSTEDLAALQAAGYAPVLYWKRTIGVGTSVTCNTSEALANIQAERARRSR